MHGKLGKFIKCHNQGKGCSSMGIASISGGNLGRFSVLLVSHHTISLDMVIIAYFLYIILRPQKICSCKVC